MQVAVSFTKLLVHIYMHAINENSDDDTNGSRPLLLMIQLSRHMGHHTCNKPAGAGPPPPWLIVCVVAHVGAMQDIVEPEKRQSSIGNNPNTAMATARHSRFSSKIQAIFIIIIHIIFKKTKKTNKQTKQKKAPKISQK